MKRLPAVRTNNEVNSYLNLQVHISTKREGFFVLEPDGSINAITSRSLQQIVERICATKPDIIVFDLKSVDFINSKGLRVILKVYRAINAQGGRVVLMNFQPHIKEVFTIINALPEQRIFESWHAFDAYLEAMQNRNAEFGCIRKSEIETGNCIICAEINVDQRSGMDSRMHLK